MSTRQAHLLQARHNEALARQFIRDGYRFRDWSVVAAFYAAVHYFEARLHDYPQLTHPEAAGQIIHTEDSIPRIDGRLKYPPHAWRERLLTVNFNRDTFSAYHDLRMASESARYHARATVARTAHEYFTDRFVDQCVVTYLGQVKSGLRVS